MNLQPQGYFTVVRQIANHTDSSTYYVRAVVRNAFTDAIIATLNLTDKSGQRFKYDWAVPADPSGQGFYVSIVTSVYTDSGYTTKSENYGDEETTYLVQERVLMRGGGGGGVDAATVRRIVSEELEKLDTPEEIDYERLKPATDRTDEVLQAIKDNVPEQAEPLDLSPLTTKLDDVRAAIDAKEVTPPTDLASVLSGLKQVATDSQRRDARLQAALDNFGPSLAQAVGTDIADQIMATLTELVKDTKFTIGPTTATMQPGRAKQEQTEGEPVPFDVAQLGL